MRFYLEYINHLGRLQKKSAHRRLQGGFTITEVLLAGLMMLIAVLVAGIGLINLELSLILKQRSRVLKYPQERKQFLLSKFPTPTIPVWLRSMNRSFTIPPALKIA